MAKPWQNKERKDAKLFGNKPTPGSGSKWFAKGDSKGEKFLIENKTTDKNNFTIKGQVWEKIEKEALLERRVPILSVQFGDRNVELVILSKNDFIELL